MKVFAWLTTAGVVCFIADAVNDWRGPIVMLAITLLIPDEVMWDE